VPDLPPASDPDAAKPVLAANRIFVLVGMIIALILLIGSVFFIIRIRQNQKRLNK